MSQKLFNALHDIGAIPLESEMDDIIFTVLEDYGYDFYRWMQGSVWVIDNNAMTAYRMGGKTKLITFPEVIQEYRKYLSQQNQQS